MDIRFSDEVDADGYNYILRKLLHHAFDVKLYNGELWEGMELQEVDCWKETDHLMFIAPGGEPIWFDINKVKSLTYC